MKKSTIFFGFTVLIIAIFVLSPFSVKAKVSVLDLDAPLILKDPPVMWARLANNFWTTDGPLIMPLINTALPILQNNNIISSRLTSTARYFGGVNGHIYEFIIEEGQPIYRPADNVPTVLLNWFSRR